MAAPGFSPGKRGGDRGPARCLFLGLRPFRAENACSEAFLSPERASHDSPGLQPGEKEPASGRFHPYVGYQQGRGPFGRSSPKGTKRPSYLLNPSGKIRLCPTRGWDAYLQGWGSQGFRPVMAKNVLAVLAMFWAPEHLFWACFGHVLGSSWPSWACFGLSGPKHPFDRNTPHPLYR
jgi:hypothetical protein